jgi:hypothetical protein
MPGGRNRPGRENTPADGDGRHRLPTYRVKFLNKLLSSDGHPVSAVQRIIRIDQADTPEDACCKAQEQFCRLEHVEHWSHHAQCCEVEVDETPANHPER